MAASSRPTPSLNIRSWPAAPSVGAAFGVLALLVTITLIGGAGWLLLGRILNAQADLASFALGLLLFALLGLAATLAYWLAAYFTLRYAADRNALIITCGGLTHIVPMANILAIYPAAQLAAPPNLRGWQGMRWPGFRAGHFLFASLDFKLDEPEPQAIYEPPADEPAAPDTTEPNRALQIATSTTDNPNSNLKPQTSNLYTYATARPSLYIITEAATYAISPAQPEQFSHELVSRRALGPTDSPAETEQRRGILAHPVWGDRTARAMILFALLINAALFAYLCLQADSLQPFLTMHWNALGQPDRIVPAGEVFRLPAFALLVVAANTALGLYVQLRDNTAARFLYAGGAAVQLVFWAAAFNIIKI